MMASANFKDGFETLTGMGHAFDALIYHPQILELVELVDAFPDATFILNHISRPLGVGPYAGNRDEVYEVWKKNMATLAERPNVVVKVGGLGNRVSGFEWDTRPFPHRPRSWPRLLHPITCTPSRSSGLNDACLRATSRWTRTPTPAL